MNHQAQYLALFQIGPVQEFIQTARKTQDYWAGSFLLSFLLAKAVEAFGEKRVVFPHVDEVALYEAAAANPIPWEKSASAESYFPSLPNRFFAVCDQPPVEDLKKASDAVKKAWRMIADAVFQKISESASHNPAYQATGIKATAQVAADSMPKGRPFNWCNEAAANTTTLVDTELWKSQIEKRSFELMYVWREKPEGEDYCNSYRETELLMGMRKATRIFEALPPQQGYACSLCGLRTALGPQAQVSRKELRTWWNDTMRKAFQHKFRQGEHLCAVCTVKRLAPSIVFKAELDIPSTSTIAAASFQKALHDAAACSHEVHEALKVSASTFKKAVKAAATEIGEPVTANIPSYFMHSRISRELLIEVDGDWFYDSFYSTRSRDRDSGLEIPKMKAALDAWKDLKRKSTDQRLQQLLAQEKKRPIQEPSRYYALLGADGDSMGELLDSLDKDGHERLSKLLAHFSSKIIPEVLKKYPSFLLYWGGDEGMVLVPLEYLPDALGDIRDIWRLHIQGQILADEEKRKKEYFPNLSLSLGAIIAHHQYPLRSAIREVHDTLEHAKDLIWMGQKKDAWAVKILKRSGAPIITRSRWVYTDLGKSEFTPLSLLGEYLAAHREGWLSPRWFADLHAAGGILGDPPEDMKPVSKRNEHCMNAKYLFDVEFKRIIHRHSAKCRNDSELRKRRDDVIAGTRKLNSILSGSPQTPNPARYRELSGLLILANYIAKGGGR